MSQVWIGGIYLKDEGGYEIILRSLNHYKKRLKSIGRSPELTNAPMFAQIVLQEANKTGPMIDPAISKINNALGRPETIVDLQADVPLYERALMCYHSDIQKAQNGTDEFYSKLISDNAMAVTDYPNIATALEKIKQISSS
ncbi:MAG: hypothetical protein EPO62_00795 [Candidatus Nitrosotenuis sp.]|nr:MAG: hypothetical protein EPO62_00795 [Candidatus Nitrosotenuis sp.]